jgi:hypothetical protein
VCDHCSCYGFAWLKTYTVFTKKLHENFFLSHHLKEDRGSRAKFYIGIFLEIGSEWEGEGRMSNFTEMVLMQYQEPEVAVFACLHVYKVNLFKIHIWLLVDLLHDDYIWQGISVLGF